MSEGMLKTFVFQKFLFLAVLFQLAEPRPVEPPSLQPQGSLPGDFRLPSGHVPFPFREASNLFPLFPLTHQFHNELLFDDGGGATINGNVDIPIPGWNGIFDLQGAFITGTSPFYTKYGHMLRPVNPLDIHPGGIAELSMSPAFGQARAAAPVMPVANLPLNFQPIKCRPPLCDPFVHSYATGVEIEQADNIILGGALDFPIPLWPYGGGVRFPFNGAMEVITPPIGILYGQHMNPVNPLKAYVERKIRQHARGRVPLNIGSPLSLLPHRRVLPPGPELESILKFQEAAAQEFQGSENRFAEGVTAPIQNIGRLAQQQQMLGIPETQGGGQQIEGKVQRKTEGSRGASERRNNLAWLQAASNHESRGGAIRIINKQQGASKIEDFPYSRNIKLLKRAMDRPKVPMLVSRIRRITERSDIHRIPFDGSDFVAKPFVRATYRKIRLQSKPTVPDRHILHGERNILRKFNVRDSSSSKRNTGGRNRNKTHRAFYRQIRNRRTGRLNQFRNLS